MLTLLLSDNDLAGLFIYLSVICRQAFSMDHVSNGQIVVCLWSPWVPHPSTSTSTWDTTGTHTEPAELTSDGFRAWPCYHYTPAGKRDVRAGDPAPAQMVASSADLNSETKTDVLVSKSGQCPAGEQSQP